MLKRIKKLFSKNNSNFNDIETLSPCTNLDKNNPYIQSLKSVWKNKNVKNIAILGPYGSGKSSIVRSFINSFKRKKKTLYFSQESLFKYYDKKKDERSDLSETIYRELLCYDSNGITYNKILKDYFGKFRFSIITNISAVLFYLVLSILLGYLLYSFATQNLIICIFSGIALFLVTFYFHFTYFLKSVKTKYVEIEVEKGTERKKDFTYVMQHPTYDINALINEIRLNKIRFIVVEDLERLKDRESLGDQNDKDRIILECLEEFKILNDTISRSKIIKKKVCFIYGLNDGCFSTPEIRSKYFDFILPVLPVVSSHNASQILMKNEFLNKKKVDDKILSNIGVFIDNKRIANTLIAEFKIHSSIQNEKQDVNKIFIMCALNVLAPKFYMSLFKSDNVLSELYSKPHLESDDLEKELDSALAKYSIADVNFKKFLLMCLRQKYIDRGYKSYLCDNSTTALTDNDNEFFKTVLARMDCFNFEINEPEKIVRIDINNEAIRKPNKYLLTYIFTKGDRDKVSLAKDAFLNEYTEESKLLFFKYIVQNYDLSTFSKIFSIFAKNEKIYTIFKQVIKELQKDDLGDYKALVYYFRCNYFPSNTSVVEEFSETINKISDFEKILEIQNDFFKIVSCSSSIVIKDVHLIKNGSDLNIIRTHIMFEISYSNLSYLYTDYKTNFLKFLIEHPDILQKCIGKSDIFGDSLLRFDSNNFRLFDSICKILNNTDRSIKFFSNKYFENYLFTMNLEKEENEYEEVYLKCGFTKVNDYCFEMFIDDKSRIAFIQINIDKIIKNQVRISKMWTLFILKNYDFNFLIKIIDLISLDISAVENATNLDSYFAIYKKNLNIQLLQSISDKDFIFLINKFENLEIKFTELANLTLSLDNLKCIFDNKKTNLYSLALMTQNNQNFKKLYITSGDSFYSDKIFVGPEGKVISCDDPEIIKWFIFNNNHSFETKSYVIEETKSTILNMPFITEFLKTFGKTLNYKNMHFSINENNKRIMAALYKSGALKRYTICTNYLSIKLK